MSGNTVNATSSKKPFIQSAKEKAAEAKDTLTAKVGSVFKRAPSPVAQAPAAPLPERLTAQIRSTNPGQAGTGDPFKNDELEALSARPRSVVDPKEIKEVSFAPKAQSEEKAQKAQEARKASEDAKARKEEEKEEARKAKLTKELLAAIEDPRKALRPPSIDKYDTVTLNQAFLKFVACCDELPIERQSAYQAQLNKLMIPVQIADIHEQEKPVKELGTQLKKLGAKLEEEPSNRAIRDELTQKRAELKKKRAELEKNLKTVFQKFEPLLEAIRKESEPHIEAKIKARLPKIKADLKKIEKKQKNKDRIVAAVERKELKKAHKAGNEAVDAAKNLGNLADEMGALANLIDGANASAALKEGDSDEEFVFI